MIVLQRPLITEKTMVMAKEGMFTFIVDKRARKELIAKTVADVFKVTVKSVKVSHIKDQRKSQKRVRAYYILSGFKKAVVQLKKGQTIALFQPEEVKDVEVKTAESVAEVKKEKKSLLKGTKVTVEKQSKVKESQVSDIKKKRKGERIVTGK